MRLHQRQKHIFSTSGKVKEAVPSTRTTSRGTGVLDGANCDRPTRMTGVCSVQSCSGPLNPQYSPGQQKGLRWALHHR
jgi:hypothetical protein